MPQLNNHCQQKSHPAAPWPRLGRWLLAVVLLLCCATLQAKTRGATLARERAVSSLQKGMDYYRSQHYALALNAFTESLPNIGDGREYGKCLFHIATIYGIFKDYERSIRYFQLCMEQTPKDEDYLTHFLCVRNIIQNYCLLEDLDAAQHYYDVMIRIPDVPDRQRRYSALFSQAQIMQTKGEAQSAIYNYEQAGEIARQSKMSPDYYGAVLANLSEIYNDIGQPRQSLDYAMQLDTLARRHDIAYMRGYALEHLMHACQSMGDTVQASRYSLQLAALNDTIFNRDQISIPKNKLDEYERSVVEGEIRMLNTRINYQTALLVLALLLVVVAAVFSLVLWAKHRQLRLAQRVLVSKANADLHRPRVENAPPVVSPLAPPVVPGGSQKEGEERTDSTEADPETTRVMRQRIERILENTELISNPDFALSHLAVELGQNVNYVSRAINTIFGKSFKQLLTEYRIRQACRLLADADNSKLTIQAVYEAVGYRAASSFINAFKKEMGMTPSVYLHLQRNP